MSKIESHVLATSSGTQFTDGSSTYYFPKGKFRVPDLKLSIAHESATTSMTSVIHKSLAPEVSGDKLVTKVTKKPQKGESK